MKFGLEQHIIDNLISVFEQHPKVDKALVFGSRAKGNYRPDSDIDIAIKGQDLHTDDIIAISVAFEEKGITQKIDLINYDTINEPDLKDHIERVGTEFYSRWKEYKIANIISLEYGKSLLNYRNGAGKYDVFGTNGKIGTSDKYLYDKPSVVIGRKGAYRETHLSKKPFFVIDTAFYTKNKLSGLDTLFLYYWFKNININEMDSGSAIPSTSRDEVYDIDIKLPPLSEQTAIANILNSLDDKIDLLHRQNKTLEELAETLFRQSFVEEAEESWEVEPLGKVFDIGIGRTPPRKEQHWFTLNPSDVKWVSIKDMGTSGIYIDTVSEYLTQEAVEKFSVPIIPENTVMLSFKMTIGRLAISTEKMISNEAIAHFKLKENSPLFPEFLYLFLKTYSWVELGSTSSIVESINSQMIKEIEMVIPSKQNLLDFKKMIRPTFYKIKSNQIQIRTITRTRDTLLPKLMSGEVRVKI